MALACRPEHPSYDEHADKASWAHHRCSCQRVTSGSIWSRKPPCCEKSTPDPGGMYSRMEEFGHRVHFEESVTCRLPYNEEREIGNRHESTRACAVAPGL